MARVGGGCFLFGVAPQVGGLGRGHARSGVRGRDAVLSICRYLAQVKSASVTEGGGPMDTLRLDLEYEWEPFTVIGQPLTFQQLAGTQLFRNECSHWGAAVFKWEGLVTRVGDSGRMGQLGVLFGEADNIAHRIQQYAAAKIGTLDHEYREGFLLSGDIRLLIFHAHRATFDNKEPGVAFRWFLDYWVAKRRAVLVELLILDYTRKHPFVWLVNRGFPEWPR